jgi:hypothetical protein
VPRALIVMMRCGRYSTMVDSDELVCVCTHGLCSVVHEHALIYYAYAYAYAYITLHCTILEV